MSLERILGWSIGWSIVTLLGPAAVAGALAHAAERPAPPPLPPEAFAACQAKKAGDACSVTFRDLVIEGVCAEPPPEVDEGALFCRPSKPPAPAR